MHLLVLNAARKYHSRTRIINLVPGSNNIINELMDLNMIVTGKDNRLYIHPDLPEIITRINSFVELLEYWELYLLGEIGHY